MNSHARMFEMIAAFKISQIIRAVCVHSLVEHLDNGLSTPTQIAEASNLDVDATDRLMRACVSVGLMTYDSGTSTFAATPVLLTLRADDPASLRSYALAQTADSHWLPWGRLDVSIKTGEPQAVATLGCNLWEYFSRFPTEGAIFSDAMRSASVSFDREVGKLVETRAADVVVDVGGASGSFVHALMEANSSLNGVVFDRQEVADAAMHAALKRGLASRFSTVSGDFFSDALPPADVYLLKLILHDWDDAACIEILRNCRRSIRAGGRLIVAEMIVGEPGDARFNPLIDLTMMVVLGGRERSIDQFRALFSATGFALTAVKPSSTRFWLIEAEAV
ncbi:methyltransferase [Paraburkholderia rhizosphaerae]|uniref:Methyltransferase family protein n=1 Tax=Paraburkholderia rhizosphaerae TaxID=480658 RepID=A0A4R8LVI1_9BURK|nr:methyltransferase [Paraburkholderia rhizosphaerae]TDY50787.1 methyltransferase family protein [Paraburkholderia rhizosphaerae]